MVLDFLFAFLLLKVTQFLLKKDFDPFFLTFCLAFCSKLVYEDALIGGCLLTI